MDDKLALENEKAVILTNHPVRTVFPGSQPFPKASYSGLLSEEEFLKRTLDFIRANRKKGVFVDKVPVVGADEKKANP